MESLIKRSSTLDEERWARNRADQTVEYKIVAGVSQDFK